MFWFMRRYFGASIRWLFCATVLFGVIYPCTIWVAAHLFFSKQAEGSVVMVAGRTVGLRYVGQTFSSPKYFFSRPSEVPQGALLISGGSNLSWSSPLLREKVQRRGINIPEDMIMASASGLDPEISIRAALSQVERIAKAQNIPEDEVRFLILREEEPTLLGLFPRRVNVLRLNCLLGY